MNDATDTARNHDDARIYDQGYRPFDGTLASPRSRFWVIAVHELRLAWKEKWFRRLLWAPPSASPWAVRWGQALP